MKKEELSRRDFIKKVMTLSDKALYCAKEKGKNRFVIYEEGMEPEGYVGRED